MKILRVLISILYWLLGIVVVVFAVGLILTKQDNQWGIRTFHVETGSMSPTIPMGSLVVVQKEPHYAVNDVITFRMENNANSFVTHRIVRVEADPDIGKMNYQTKGDANKTPDPETVAASRVVGKVIFHVPYLGIPMSFVRTQTGFILLIIVPGTILIYSELVNIKNEIVRMWRSGRKKKHVQAAETN